MIFTFYSFKGGVGRSMALANTAHLLAYEHGLNVLMVDFDLEAPGLEHYFFDDLESDATSELRNAGGVLDLLLEYKAELCKPVEGSDALDLDIDLETDYFAPVYRNLPRGCLDLLRAGRRETPDELSAYGAELQSFDWRDFYHRWGGDAFFRWLKSEIAARYDVALVDSRTGLTEIGGVCAYLLADACVLFCAPNQQNLAGVRQVLDNFRSPRVAALRDGRPLPSLVIPARVDVGADAEELEDFRRRFEDEFAGELPEQLEAAGRSLWDLRLPYDPGFAVDEQVAATSRVVDETQLGKSYRALTSAIALLAQDGSRLRAVLDEARSDARPLTYDARQRSAGYDVYLSARATDTMAHRVRDWLEELGASVAFDGVAEVPGEGALERTARALSAARRVFVVISGGELSSWQAFEAGMAVHSKKASRVLCLRPEAAHVPPVLGGCEVLDVRLEDHELAEETKSAIKRLLDRDLRSRAQRRECPFVGSAFYDEHDVAKYVAPPSALERLVAAVSESPLVVLTGSSASGKTSLVRAGLRPGLRRGAVPGSERWSVVDLGESADPLAGLTEQLWPLYASDGAPGFEDADHWAAHLRDEPASFARDVARLTNDGERPLLLVIDPLESVLSNAEAAVDLARVIAAGLRPGAEGGALPVGVEASEWMRAVLAHPPPARAPMRVLGVVRADKLAAFHERQPWDVLLGAARTVEVQQPSLRQLEQALVAPVRAAGLAFEPGLSKRILTDLRSAPSPWPLLQETMCALWEGRREGFLTNEAYERSGGIVGTVCRLSDRALAVGPAERELAVDMMLRMLHPIRARSHGTRPVAPSASGPSEHRASSDAPRISTPAPVAPLTSRRRARAEEILPHAGPVERAHVLVERMVSGRVVVACAEIDGAASYELVHDAMLDAWTQLRAAVPKWRVPDSTLAVIADATSRWVASDPSPQDRDPGLLLSGVRLARVAPALTELAPRLTHAEHAYVEASRNQRMKRRALGGFLSVVMLGALLLVGYDLFVRYYARPRSRAAAAQALLRDTRSYGEARRAAIRLRALGREGEASRLYATFLRREALAAMNEEDLDRALLLHLEQLEWDDSVANRRAAAAIAALYPRRFTSYPQQDGFLEADEGLLVLRNPDGTTEVRDARSAGPGRTLVRESRDEIRRAYRLGEHRLLLLVSGPPWIRIWDVANEPRQIAIEGMGGDERITEPLAISADRGTLVATGTNARLAWLTLSTDPPSVWWTAAPTALERGRLRVVGDVLIATTSAVATHVDVIERSSGERHRLRAPILDRGSIAVAGLHTGTSSMRLLAFDPSGRRIIDQTVEHPLAGSSWLLDARDARALVTLAHGARVWTGTEWQDVPGPAPVAGFIGERAVLVVQPDGRIRSWDGARLSDWGQAPDSLRTDRFGRSISIRILAEDVVRERLFLTCASWPEQSLGWLSRDGRWEEVLSDAYGSLQQGAVELRGTDVVARVHSDWLLDSTDFTVRDSASGLWVSGRSRFTGREAGDGLCFLHRTSDRCGVEPWLHGATGVVARDGDVAVSAAYGGASSPTMLRVFDLERIRPQRWAGARGVTPLTAVDPGFVLGWGRAVNGLAPALLLRDGADAHVMGHVPAVEDAQQTVAVQGAPLAHSEMGDAIALTDRGIVRVDADARVAADLSGAARVLVAQAELDEATTGAKVEALAMSPNGRHVAAVLPSSVLVWATSGRDATLRMRATMVVEADASTASTPRAPQVILSNGGHVAWGGASGLFVAAPPAPHEAPDVVPVRLVPGLAQPIAFSRQEGLLADTRDGLALFDVASGARRCPAGHWRRIRLGASQVAALSPDGRYVGVLRGSTLLVLSSRTCSVLATQQLGPVGGGPGAGHGGELLRFAPSSRALLAIHGRMLRWFSVAEHGVELDGVIPLDGRVRGPLVLQRAPDGWRLHAMIQLFASTYRAVTIEPTPSLPPLDGDPATLRRSWQGRLGVYLDVDGYARPVTHAKGTAAPKRAGDGT